MRAGLLVFFNWPLTLTLIPVWSDLIIEPIPSATEITMKTGTSQ